MIGGYAAPMRRLALLLTALLAACASAFAEPQDCPPGGYDRARLEALREAGWAIASVQERRAFALALPRCLASSDPFLRDAVAFEGLARMLRSGQLDQGAQNALIVEVLPRLESREPGGFEASFAALTLSELVRAERINSHFTDDMRADVLDRSIQYFQGVRDYRGFDAQEGWRHGVAHGADLLMQLALNESLGREDLLRIRDAIATQVAPEEHFYIYGESARLARVISAIAHRGLITEDEWTQWFARFPSSGEDVYASQAGLAWRHNTLAFLQAVWFNARSSEETADDAVLPGVEAALRAMP